MIKIKHSEKQQNTEKTKFLSLSLTSWIFIAMILGIIVGVIFPSFAVSLRPYGRMFITMIKGIIAPLVFSTLVVGIAGAGNIKTVGRIGLKALIYFEIVTTLALFIGLGAANLIKPGVGVVISSSQNTKIPGMNLSDIESSAGLQITEKTLDTLKDKLPQDKLDNLKELKDKIFTRDDLARTLKKLDFMDEEIKVSLSHTEVHKQSLGEIIQHLFTPSIVESMAKGDVLQIVVFTIFFSLAVIAVGSKAKPVLDLCESLAEIMFKFTAYIMLFAPFGVGAAIAAAVGEHGIQVLYNLGKLVFTLYGSLFIFILFVLVPVTFIIRLPLKKFINAVKEPVVIAFSTTSSEAALPKALIAMEKLGVPKSIVGFVIPTGYSFNLDGTTLYLSLASIFIAQAAGVHLTFSQQITMMITLMLTSKGVAGVPRASLIILAGTLSSFNLPVEGVLIILGIDEIMDMGRTAVNVLGNCLASAVVARWECWQLEWNNEELQGEEGV